MEEHKDLRNDYDVERDNRRRYQNSVEEKQNVVGEHERQLVSCSPCQHCQTRRIRDLHVTSHHVSMSMSRHLVQTIVNTLTGV